jgi:hypothetical protein
VADEPLRLARSGREYFTLTFTPALPDGVTVEARINYRNTEGDWHPVDLVDGEHKILLRGPLVTDTTSGHPITDSGTLETRITDNPEIIIRNGARISLYS